MPRTKKVAVLLDGGFVIKRLRHFLDGEYPEASQVLEFAQRCVRDDEELFRIYYYDCPPFDGVSVNPVSGEEVDFSKTSIFEKLQRLQRELAVSEYVAFRKGVLILNGWRLNRYRAKQLAKNNRALQADDFEPDLEQKRVDMKIGLDVAWMAIKGIVDSVILVAGDTDIVPAMDFARQQGMRVILVPMENPYLSESMLEHSDEVREVRYP
ncbi:MAG: NYN domain-containing protein [Coriobacteriia bacterium]